MKKMTKYLSVLFIMIFPLCLFSQEIVEQEETDNKVVADSWEDALTKKNELQVLTLVFKDLENLPAEIGSFRKLEEIYLSDNKLKSLPSELFTLSGLKMLDISRNFYLKKIPSDISKLTNLEFLKFGFNEELNYAETFQNISGLQKLANVDIMGNQLVKLPPEIGKLSQIKSLNLANNRLSALPKEIGQLAHLESLDLSQNQLDNLPMEIKNLKNLKHLKIHGNRFSDEKISEIKAMFPNCRFDL